MAAEVPMEVLHQESGSSPVQESPEPSKPSESLVIKQEGADEVDIAEVERDKEKTREKELSIDREESEIQIDARAAGEARSQPKDGIELVEEGDTNAQPDEAAVPEKLADDVILPPLWKRVLYRVFPKLQKIEKERRIRANDAPYNASFKYAKNPIYTSKYNVITFVPKNLFEQFLRVANLYFLVLLIIQLIPGVSSVGFYTTLIPLVGVLGVTMFKDLYDDVKRHISDYKVNHRIAKVLGSDGKPEPYVWEKVKVGDILRLENNDFITADILLLSSSEPNSLIYVETAELDGETNLKVRQPLPETADFGDDPSKLLTFNGEVVCEPPNNRLHKFRGRMDWNDQSYSLDNDQIVLRGCKLRNTSWMFGMVVYAGHDTKLVQNSGKTKFKRTHMDQFMNRAVLFILAFMTLVVSACLIGSLIFEYVYGARFLAYTPYYSSAQDNPAELAFLQILSNTIVLSNFIPISLYVSVEVIRLGLSIFINLDLKMYYPPEDVPAIARTTALNEELGQIEYIFSDKTGTLTQNVMTFLKCSIQGKKYGDTSPDDMEKEVNVATGEVTSDKKSVQVERVDFSSWNSYADEDFVYYDSDFVEKCRRGEEDCAEFWKLLALCHTVLPSKESEESNKLVYNAQSPDEAALVAAAKNFGFVFKDRDPFTLTMDNLSTGMEEKYEVLNILDFNNERKRMSVIVKYEGKITLYCKGADSVVLARLGSGNKELKKTTLCHLAGYAREGLRTLVLAKKELTPEQYAAWHEDYYKASLLQEDRDQQVDIVYSRIEQDLTLIGATAIEDKLQDGVPEAIANLAKADIKIWVLTGDKQETAINIGYSCHLLTEDMKVFIVDEDSHGGVSAQLQEADEAIRKAMEGKGGGKKVEATGSEETRPLEEVVNLDDEDSLKESTGPPFGIVINGHSLRYALKEDMKLKFLETAAQCSAVICCRVTPLQKKKVVDLVKRNKKAVTLAIGDGANDVGMIKAAHIGVGISGREGQQAVLSSDFSFGQFRYLERLLLVHGHWSYHRMTTFLRYFFYKNFAFTFTQFIYAFFCGFTAQTLYDSTYIAVYNVIYTSIPVLVLGILDQDVDENNCYRYPKLYITGQKNLYFNSSIFVRSLVKGIYVAIIIFFVLFGMVAFNVYPSGYEWDYQSYGLAASGALTVIVNLQIALDTTSWNPIMHFFVWLSIISWFVVIPITSTEAFYGSFFQFGGVAYEVLATPNFWFYLPLSSVISLLPTIMFRLFNLYRRPTYVDFIKLKQKSEGFKLFRRIKFSRKPKSDRDVPQEKPRSGYAFSHQEGYAALITTGHIFGMNKDEIDREQFRRRSIIGTPRPSISSQGVTITVVEEEEVEVQPATEFTKVEPIHPIEDNVPASSRDSEAREEENASEIHLDVTETSNSQKSTADPSTNL